MNEPYSHIKGRLNIFEHIKGLLRGEEEYPYPAYEEPIKHGFVRQTFIYESASYLHELTLEGLWFLFIMDKWLRSEYISLGQLMNL